MLSVWLGHVWLFSLDWWSGSIVSNKCNFCDERISDIWKMSAHVQACHPEHSFKCPRQDEARHLFPYPEHSAFYRTDGTCSHCGSIRPEMLFEAIKQGTAITPTDKNYKVYVGGTRKFYFQHLSAEQQEKFVALLNDKQMVLSEPGHFYVLPFFCRRV